MTVFSLNRSCISWKTQLFSAVLRKDELVMWGWMQVAQTAVVGGPPRPTKI